MKYFWRVVTLVLAAAAVWWFAVPAARMSLVAHSWEAPLLEQAKVGRSESGLVLLNKSCLMRYLDGLPVVDLTIERERPWNAVVTVSLADPDIVIRQGKLMAAVFFDLGKSYALPSASSTWNVLDVSGFPTDMPAFLSTSLEYAALCADLLKAKDKLAIAALSLTPLTGLSARLKDGKTLVFGDAENARSKIERAIAVIAMPAVKDKKVSIDLRFDGQAVIPGAP